MPFLFSFRRFIMKFFESITNNLPKSFVDNLPGTEQVSSAVGTAVGAGLSVGLSVAVRAMLNVNNSNCSEAGYENLDSAMLQATFQSLVLTLGLVGLNQVQKAFGIEPTSAIVGGECAVFLLGGLQLINSRAATNFKSSNVLPPTCFLASG